LIIIAAHLSIFTYTPIQPRPLLESIFPKEPGFLKAKKEELTSKRIEPQPLPTDDRSRPLACRPHRYDVLNARRPRSWIPLRAGVRIPIWPSYLGEVPALLVRGGVVIVNLYLKTVEFCCWAGVWTLRLFRFFTVLYGSTTPIDIRRGRRCFVPT
jgi:hypothetical protein